MKVKFTGLTPTLQVHDLDEAIAFYTSLGFETAWIWPEEAPSHASLKRDEISFMISLVDKSNEIQTGDLYFWVDDIDAYSIQLKDAGIDVPDITNADYGMRDTSITDPWGHQLTFGTPL